jgi:hypothetical protein
MYQEEEAILKRTFCFRYMDLMRDLCKRYLNMIEDSQENEVSRAPDPF